MTTVQPGGSLTYTIVVANAGPSAVTRRPGHRHLPGRADGQQLDLHRRSPARAAPPPGRATPGPGRSPCRAATAPRSRPTVTVAANAPQGSLANTATVATVGPDRRPGHEPTTARPTPTRSSCRCRRSRSSTTSTGPTPTRSAPTGARHAVGQAAIRVNANQASADPPGLGDLERRRHPLRRPPGRGVHLRQRAPVTSSATPSSPDPQGERRRRANTPANYIRVGYYAAARRRSPRRPTPAARTPPGRRSPTTFASGDTLSAVALETGTVNVYKTSGATTTVVGTVTIPGAGFWTGTGRIGILLPSERPGRQLQRGRPCHEPPDSRTRPPAVEGENVMSERRAAAAQPARPAQGRRPDRGRDRGRRRGRRSPPARVARASRRAPRRGPAAGPQARRDRRLDLPAADPVDLLEVARRRDPSRPLRPGRPDDLHLRVRQRDSGISDVEPVPAEEQGAAQRAALLGEGEASSSGSS